MSYAESTTGLATHLARLLAAHATDLGHNGYEQALLTRETTLALACEVHRHLTGGPDPASNRQSRAPTTDPVPAFGQALTDHHQKVSRLLSPAEALSAFPSTPGGREWQHAARYALLADDDWKYGAHPPWTRSRQWAALADVAALTEAVTVLDHDLAHAARALGRDGDAAVLECSVTSSLRRAAAEVQAHARFGPLTPVEVASPRRTPGRVVLVSSDADLATAETRLARLLTGSRHLRPEHAVQVALGQARSAAALAAMLRAAPHPDAGASRLNGIATALDSAAQALAPAGSAPGRTASLDRGDPRPLLQAGELDRFLLTRSRSRDEHDVVAMVGFAGALPDVLAALFDLARRHIARGEWLVPTQDHASTWTRFRVGLREPALVTTAGPALAAAERVRAAAAAVLVQPPVPGRASAARTVLGSPLLDVRTRQPLAPPAASRADTGRAGRGRGR